MTGYIYISIMYNIIDVYTVSKVKTESNEVILPLTTVALSTPC